MARSAAICAETSVEASTAFLLRERAANTPGGVYVHSVGGGGLVLRGKAGLGKRGGRLGGERSAGGGMGLAASAGRVSRGLVELHRNGGGDKRLKGGGKGTTAGEFISDGLFQLLHKFKN